MKINFYKEFEDRFRGTRNIIKDRLQVYLPFIAPLKEIYSAPQAVDLGCGRGEFLEILNENGFIAQGIDLDDGMFATCQETGLNVQKGEALSFLRQIKKESLAIITAIHLAEHMPFRDLNLLIKESIRVLKPAGLLIIETPNPENIIVGSSSFYTDPTHLRPIPVELLQFMVENNGYEKIKVLRLQEPNQNYESNSLSLFSVLNGVSRDYAIIAQKQTDPKILEKFSKAFEKNYGYNLYDKVSEYDSILLKEITDNSMKEKISYLERKITTIRQKQGGIEKELITKLKHYTHEKEFTIIKQKICDIEKEFTAIKQKNFELETKLEKIFKSKSWHYTKPLRCLNNYFQQALNMKRKIK